MKRDSSTYRSARRNTVFRTDHGVWRATSHEPSSHRRAIVIEYRPVVNKGKTYKPNGEREVSRRLGLKVA